MNDNKPSLRALLALPVMKTVGGVELPIKPMGWYQAAQALEPLVPVMADLPVMMDSAGDQAEAWMAAVISFRNELSEFITLATGFDAQELRELPPTHVAELVMCVVEVNADFFVQMLPRLAEVFGQRMVSLAQKFGPAVAQAVAVVKASQAQIDQALSQGVSQEMKSAGSPTSSSAS